MGRHRRPPGRRRARRRLSPAMGLLRRRGPRTVSCRAEPHSCTLCTCGSCKPQLVTGKVWELTESAITLNSEEPRAGYILLCQAVTRGPLELDVPGFAEIPDHPLRHTRGVIDGQQPLTPQHRQAATATRRRDRLHRRPVRRAAHRPPHHQPRA
jgi:hypothetical protein